MAENATPRLTVTLVPREQWGANLSQSLKGARWDTLRKVTYSRAGNVCEVCGGVGKQHPVEAHEVWDYDDTTGVQRLVRLIALCPACHAVQHFGRSAAMGQGPEALAHLRSVNGWDAQTAKAHIDRAKAVWDRRNKVAWTLDLAVLTDYGVEPPTQDELAAGAARARHKLEQDRRPRSS